MNIKRSTLFTALIVGLTLWTLIAWAAMLIDGRHVSRGLYSAQESMMLSDLGEDTFDLEWTAVEGREQIETLLSYGVKADEIRRFLQE